MKVKYEICSQRDVSKLQDFIHLYWKKNHILYKSTNLLKFQHKFAEKYNFVIAKNSTGGIIGILGFIPTYQFDDALLKNRDFWLAIWKVGEIDKYPGVGFQLLKWFEKEFRPNMICSIGITPIAERIYQAAGFKTGELYHYFRKNNNLKKFKIAKIIKCDHSDSGGAKKSSLRKTHLLKNFQYGNTYPKKTIDYIQNRYINHPYYNYITYEIITSNQIVAYLIIRIQNYNNSCCIRIIDIIGDYKKIESLFEEFDYLLKIFNAEYIECYNYGLKESYFKKWGLINKNSTDSIIPEYFSPFRMENVQVSFAIKSKYENFSIFKGDSDQDRPS